MTKKVIIIDDSIISLNIAKTAFTNDGWEVYGVQYANDALKILYDVAPDLIVTDAIMPVMGGFQLLKLLRSEPKTSKIPVIVYSILDEKNSKFYIKKERAEYYLKKDKNIDDLISLATYVCQTNPIDDEYKYEILKTNLKPDDIFLEDNKEKEPTPIKPEFDKNKLEADFKKQYDFTKADDKIFSEVFSMLYPILNYNLCIVCVDSFEKNEKTVYFDIRDIILSPIFQNNILSNFNAKNSYLFKKYAPNLKIITNEEEFLTKISFDFEYKETTVGNIIFYSKEKSKWDINSDIEDLRDILNNFFKARYINKSSHVNVKNNISDKYFINKFDFKFDTQSKKEMYTAVVEIANYKELQESMPPDELDYLNSRISEKLIGFIGDDEQILKNSQDEYSLVFYVKNKEHAMQKLEWICDLIAEIEIEDNKIEILIGASDCKIDGQYNFYEAQNRAHDALDSANNQNRIVIYGTE